MIRLCKLKNRELYVFQDNRQEKFITPCKGVMMHETGQKDPPPTLTKKRQLLSSIQKKERCHYSAQIHSETQ